MEREFLTPMRLFRNGRAEETKTSGELHLLLMVKQVDGSPVPRDVWTREILGEWIHHNTGIAALNVTVVTNYEFIAEFDANIIVTNVSILLQKVTVLKGLGVQVTCLVATPDKLMEVVETRESKRSTENTTSKPVDNDLQVEMFKALTQLQDQMQQLQVQVAASRSKTTGTPELTGQVFYTPTISGESEATTSAGTSESQASQLSEPLIPIIPLAGARPKTPNAVPPNGGLLDTIIPTSDPTPVGNNSVAFTDHSKIKLRLPTFSGDEVRNKHEVDFKSWLFKVNMLIGKVPEMHLRQLIIDSLRGSAGELMMFLGLDTPVSVILERMKNQFGDVASADVLMTRFYELRQGKTEKVAVFYARLVGTLDQIKKNCPDSMDESTASQHLKNRLWFGMHASYRNSLRYLYDQSTVTHQQLLTAVRALEAESSLTVRAKSASVLHSDTNNDDEDSEDTNTGQVQLKGASFSGRKTFTKFSNPSRNDGKGQNKQNGQNQNASNGNGNTNNSQGNSRNQRGRRFGKGGKKCYGCGGVGHFKRECPTWLNQNRGQMKEGDLPPGTEQGNQDREDPTPPSQ